MRRLLSAVTVLSIAGSAVSSQGQCTSSWHRDSTGGQNGRWNHAMVYDAARQRVVMYGGENPGILSEMYWWNGAAWVPIENEDGPSFRTGHSMAYDIVRDRVVLFGGRNNPNNNGLGGDTWEFDGAAWVQVAATGPQARRNASMVYDAARGKCVLFGGGLVPGGPTTFGDTWEWDGAAWQDVTATAGNPGPSGYPLMAYDSDRRLTVLTDFQNVWEYSGAQWQLVNTAGPGRRYESAIDYDPIHHRVVLYGGSTSTSIYGGLPDTWTWDGSQWQLQTGGCPGFRAGSAIAFDVSRGRHVMYGGPDAITTIAQATTWTWDGVGGPVPPIIVKSPSPVNAYNETTVIMSVQALSTEPMSYQWRRNGTPISNGTGGASVGGGTVSGVEATQLVIGQVQISDSGSYDVVVSGPAGQSTSTAAAMNITQAPPPPPPPPDHCESPNCYANCDHSTGYPCLTANDFQCFLTAFAMGQSYANCDGTTMVPVLTANDFHCFLNVYAAGCF